MTRQLFTLVLLLAGLCATAQNPIPPVPTLHQGFETEDALWADFVSQSHRYAALTDRGLAITPGRFGNGLTIEDGWPISKGSWNESGLDCDLVVAVMWGEWHKKPHYWGAGKFCGNQGTVAFWVKSGTLRPGIVFMQGSIAWGRKERDLFTVEVDQEGRFSAHIRDVRSEYHRVAADRPTWRGDTWQHVAVVYDRAQGLQIYLDGALAGSTWGQDRWWQTPLPGLFSPFLPESSCDELYYFDTPLSAGQIAALYQNNRIEAAAPSETAPEATAAQDRLLSSYADLSALELPTVAAGSDGLFMKQTEVVASQDGKVPVWWVMDGRYELAWPHPYRLFTFILGDADYHGSKVDLRLAPGEQPDYIAIEGCLDKLRVLAGAGISESEELEDAQPMLELGDYTGFYYSKKVDLGGSSILRLPFLQSYGSPPGLEGSAHLPLTGDTRIHEIHLWQTGASRKEPAALSWPLSPAGEASWAKRYRPALEKIRGGHAGTVIASGGAPASEARVPMAPLESIHLVSPGLQPDRAVDSLLLDLWAVPKAQEDYLWIKLRDPGNPNRIWAQTCLRVLFSTVDEAQEIRVELDIADLMLAGEDRLLIELTSAHGGALVAGGSQGSSLGMRPSEDPKASLETYAAHEMRPCRAQYMKEYNYCPWRFTGERVSILDWSNFGGPYDMIHPALAVLRHDPGNTLAQTYQTLLLERDRSGFRDLDGRFEPVLPDVPATAPTWAVWQRELYALNEYVSHWGAGQQQTNGMFWGGPNDDSFLPLGWAPMSLLGDEITRHAWLRFYEGLEELGIFKDGYCDIWPIDPLHITDFITSRGLMLAFALGDPYVFERELRTAFRYTECVQAANARRAERGLPPLSPDARIEK